MAVCVVVILLSSVFVIGWVNPSFIVGREEINTHYLVIYILKASSLTGLVVGCVYYLASLSKALFHEATVVLNRRQALRYGRLYVHINRSDLGKADLEKAFKSTEPFSTAFKDIDLKVLSDNQFKQLSETVLAAIQSAKADNGTNKSMQPTAKAPAD